MLSWADSGGGGHMTIGVVGSTLHVLCFWLSLGSGSCFGGGVGIKVKSEIIWVLVRESLFFVLYQNLIERKISISLQELVPLCTMSFLRHGYWLGVWAMEPDCWEFKCDSNFSCVPKLLNLSLSYHFL